MVRWQPGARERLVVAGVDLFTEQGYDETTVAQIAERAGLTRSTFFRHFADKREMLAAGQAVLSRLLADGVRDAPPEATPLEAVAAGVARASEEMGPLNRELGPRIRAAVAASAELQARDALKTLGLAGALRDALEARGVPRAPARLAAEVGVLAFTQGFEDWTAASDDGPLAPWTARALADLRQAAARLG